MDNSGTTRPRRRRARTWLVRAAQVAAILAIIAVVGVLTQVAMNRADKPNPADTPVATAPTPYYSPPPTLLVIGDSLAGGVLDPDIPEQYPQVLADELGMDLNQDVIGGRGFTPNDLNVIGVDKIVPPFIERLQRNKEFFRADYIVLDGGRNDLGDPPAETVAAFDNYVTKLREAYPDAKITVILPSYVTTAVADLYPMLASDMRAVAERNGAYVLDPVTEGWYQGVDLKSLLWQDEVHFNSKGVHFYAEKIADGMRRLGIVPATPPAPRPQ